MRFAEKVAIVTCGGSRIGLAVAQRFAADGAFVYITGRRQAELDRAAANIGPHATAVRGDVTIAAYSEHLHAKVEREKGRLDLLLISAGLAEFANLEDITEEHYDRCFDLNARATLFTVQKVLPLMRRGSAIVLVGSVADSIGTPGYGTYNASKAAMRSFARTWKKGLAGRGVRVNVVSSGPTDTPMTEAASIEIIATLTNLIRWDAWAGQKKSPRLYAFWHPMKVASLQVLNFASTEG